MNGDSQQVPDGGNWQYKPGDDATNAPSTSGNTVPASSQPAASAPAAVSPVNPAPFASPVPDNDAPESAQQPVQWTASEYIAHEKDSKWYMELIAAAVVLAVAIFFVTHDIISTALVGIVAFYLGALANRKPRVLAYHIDGHGITIQNKFYPFGSFKSFGVLDEGPFSSIIFMPMKRFMPTLSIYYPPEQQDEIASLLSGYLPFEPVRFDAVDNLLRRIHY